MSLLKQQLYKLCINYIDDRIQTAEKAIESARESVHDDIKSSAGDKYETGREMMQQGIDQNTRQLHEARKLKMVLQTITPEISGEMIRNGSLVFTNYGTFYIAISAGQLLVDSETYFAVSALSPIGALLLGLKKGDSFNFNGKKYTVMDVK